VVPAQCRTTPTLATPPPPLPRTGSRPHVPNSTRSTVGSTPSVCLAWWTPLDTIRPKGSGFGATASVLDAAGFLALSLMVDPIGHDSAQGERLWRHRAGARRGGVFSPQPMCWSS